MPGRIVVGVDDSEGSRRALRWALEEAAAHDMSVDVLHAWHYPYVGDVSGMSYAVPATEIEKAARLQLEHSVEHARPLPPGVEVEQILVEGPAARSLLEAAGGADLLVVGSRGRGGFTGLLLGSVSQQCAHHAPCPIVIVPSTPAD